MSSFSGDIGREDEDGGGWDGLLPSPEEREEERRDRDRAVLPVGPARSPAPGAVAMREAAIAALTPILDSYAGFHDETGDREALVVQECIGIIRALSAPEVPEAVKEWCGHFRACVANSDEEDIWPEADFNLLAYFEKEYPDA